MSIMEGLHKGYGDKTCKVAKYMHEIIHKVLRNNDDMMCTMSDYRLSM